MGKRLLLRLSTRCNNGCDHCTVGDLRAQYADRDTASVVEALTRAQESGCDEVVFLRGEPTIRQDIFQLCRAARDLGFRLVQLQSNGRMLCVGSLLDRLVKSGATHFEVSLYGADSETHDAIARAPGAFAQTCQGIRAAGESGRLSQINVPIVAANAAQLSDIVALSAELGARRVQLNFQRPVDGPSPTDDALYARLSTLSGPLRDAIELGQRRRVEVATEAIPWCFLGPHRSAASDARPGATTRETRIDDLHRVCEELAPLWDAYRARSPRCEGCAGLGECPTTWKSYVARFGDDELEPLSS